VQIAQPAAKPAQPAAKPAQPAAKPAQPAASPAQKPAAPKEPAETPAKSAWWVQTNSYTNRSLADNSKEVLKSKGIASVVTPAVVNGKTYYRVRVGPYTSRTEAEYWLSLIKTIKDMENSQIWQSQ
jgi:DedD protein